MDFKNKNIAITGATGGIGSNLAEQLCQLGANVINISRSESQYEDILADLSNREELASVCDVLVNKDVDILINLAGKQFFGPLTSCSFSEVEKLYYLNLLAPVLLTQAVLPRMKEKNKGRIVNIGSIFASINFPHFAHYSSSKAGLRGFSESLRRELSGVGIEVNYVAPRAVKTDFNNQSVMEYAKITKMNMDSANDVAKSIIQAIKGNKANVYLGFPESLFVRVNALLPSLVDKSLSKHNTQIKQIFN